jgi:hypothetical protein
VQKTENAAVMQRWNNKKRKKEKEKDFPKVGFWVLGFVFSIDFIHFIPVLQRST